MVTTIVFDTAGRQSTVNVAKSGVSPGLALGYTYATTGGGVNQLATQTIDGVTQATVAYDTLGRQAGVTYGNGTAKTASTFDTYQWPTLIEYKQGATAIASETLTFQAVTGRVKDQTVDGVDAYPAGDNFTYDTAGRLTAWRGRDPSSTNLFAGPCVSMGTPPPWTTCGTGQPLDQGPRADGPLDHPGR